MDMITPDNAFYVISYPRSGNTWAINSLKLLFNGIRCEAYSDFRYYPYLWQSDNFNMKTEEKITDGRVAIIKSHCQVDNFIAKYPQKKVIYVLRDGRDTLLSYYFYRKAIEKGEIRINYYGKHNIMYGGVDNGVNTEFIESEFMKFLQTHAILWKNHIAGWMDYREKMTIRYEQMSKDLSKILTKVSRYLQILPLANEQEIANFWEKRFRNDIFRNSNGDFFRKGIVGDWRNYYSKEHIREFYRTSGDLNCQLGYT